ncbi:MAG TPA: hypothetical protein VHJ38_04605, partial [Nitrososphaeraceae archaeon]|nr:hypothetical protein [Nitrososphaeraceae archaeon]
AISSSVKVGLVKAKNVLFLGMISIIIFVSLLYPTDLLRCMLSSPNSVMLLSVEFLSFLK